jgi:hypothetical protein
MGYCCVRLSFRYGKQKIPHAQTQQRCNILSDFLQYFGMIFADKPQGDDYSAILEVSFYILYDS